MGPHINNFSIAMFFRSDDPSLTSRETGSLPPFIFYHHREEGHTYPLPHCEKHILLPFGRIHTNFFSELCQPVSHFPHSTDHNDDHIILFFSRESNLCDLSK